MKVTRVYKGIYTTVICGNLFVITRIRSGLWEVYRCNEEQRKDYCKDYKLYLTLRDCKNALKEYERIVTRK